MHTEGEKTTSTTAHTPVISEGSTTLKAPVVLENGYHCLGWALRFQPLSEQSFIESVSLELRNILRQYPGALLTVLTLYNRTLFGGHSSSSQVEWTDQDVQISVSYPLPSVQELETHPDMLEELQKQIRHNVDSVLAWASHTRWHTSPIAWERTLQTAREWENVSTFVHPSTWRQETYQLASTAPTRSEANKLRITNRVWWDEASQCFMVTECSYEDFSIPPDYESDPLQMSHQLVRNHCPCQEWKLPTPLSNILIGVDSAGEAAALNLQFGHRMAMAHAYDESTNTWHPLLFSICLRAAAAGLRAYVATHTPDPWIKLRTYVGRQQLTFLEDAHEDEYPRQLLFWDYSEPPTYDVMNRYSNVGTVVWTRLEQMDQCIMLFPTYVVECQWPESPQHHVERYTGILHTHGKKRQIRCVADRVK